MEMVFIMYVEGGIMDIETFKAIRGYDTSLHAMNGQCDEERIDDTTHVVSITTYTYVNPTERIRLERSSALELDADEHITGFRLSTEVGMELKANGRWHQSGWTSVQLEGYFSLTPTE